jgi:predicted nucleic-acid-binding protein
MKRAYVDANVILRLVTGDPPEMADAAETMFRLVDDGDLELLIEPVVIAEAVWVLSSFYGFSPSEIAPTLRTFLAGEGIIGDDKDALLEALQLYEDRDVDFVDALLAVRMTKEGVREVYSFDKHFGRIEGLRRLRPGA